MNRRIHLKAKSAGIFIGLACIGIVFSHGSAFSTEGGATERRDNSAIDMALPQPTPMPTPDYVRVSYPGDTSTPEPTPTTAPTPPPAPTQDPASDRQNSSEQQKNYIVELTIECIDVETGKLIKTIQSERIVTQKVFVGAPKISGYQASESVQSIEIKEGKNNLKFYYGPQTGNLNGAIGHAYGKSYITGDAEGNFRPDDKIKRGEALSMFHDFLEMDSQAQLSAQQWFGDVSQSDWFYRPVMLLARQGIIDTENGGSFRPEEEMTWSEFIYYALLLADIEPDEKNSGYMDFADTKAYESDIRAAYDAGLTSGFPDGSFDPEGPITKAEAVVILNNILGCEGLSAGNAFPDVPVSHWAYKAIVAAATDHSHQ